MKLSRNVRRCAIQVMYQFDLGRTDALDCVRDSLADSPGSEESHQAGYDLALRAWEHREDADRVLSEFSHDWPIYRQPALDRTILRLAHFEMTQLATPPKIVINEAIELAREFSTDKSPRFINGILDRLYRSLSADDEDGDGDRHGDTLKEHPPSSASSPDDTSQVTKPGGVIDENG